MRNLLKLLVIAPIALLFLAFALANRHSVIVSFDPFNSGDISSPQIELPLFIMLIGAMMVGVIVGGIATWFRQGRFRAAARHAKVKAEDLRVENAALRSQLAALAPERAQGSTGQALAASRRGAAA
jgi:uncharacterized integral membrane protein